MGILVGKGTQLIFDAGTITGTLAMDQAIKERGILESTPKDIMDLLVGMEDIARHLVLACLRLGKVRKE